MSDSTPVSFEEFTLTELVALRQLVEAALEAAGVAHEPRSAATSVLSLSHAVAELVNPPLQELSERHAIQAAMPTVKHLVRDAQGELSQVIDLPANVFLAPKPSA
jgi:hypothetical protein